VECYAGYRGEQTPRRFFLGARRVEITEVLDAWLTPHQRCFRVRGDDGKVYLLRHDPEAGDWQVEPSAAGRGGVPG
jgi:hypothetical protein